MAISTDQSTASAYDEAFRADGSPRPGYRELVGALADLGFGEARERLNRHLATVGVTFGDDAETYRVDPLPRVIEAGEWCRVRAGLAQRYEAMNAFLDDAYGERSVIEQGVMPARVIEGSMYYEPLAERPRVASTAAIAGPDLIRDPGGELLVLEDDLRTPSGIAYAIACRKAVLACGLFPEPSGLDPTLIFDPVTDALREADLAGHDEPSLAMLSDGPASKAWFEHREIADGLGIPVVETSDLESRRGRLFARVDDERIEVHVLYNRSSDETLRLEDGRLSPLGDLLEDPLEGGNLACVNSFGAGVGDDKAVHCYVDEMIRFYLGEQPLLRSVPGFDLGRPEQRKVAMGRLDELVIKPRWSFGGQGIVLGPKASADELDRVRFEIDRSPSRFVAQPTVPFSVHPTVAGDRLEPRHVDLRAFVLSAGDGSVALPVALTRFAAKAGEMVVNSTRGGGAKDTWLLEESSVEREGTR